MKDHAIIGAYSGTNFYQPHYTCTFRWRFAAPKSYFINHMTAATALSALAHVYQQQNKYNDLKRDYRTWLQELQSEWRNVLFPF